VPISAPRLLSWRFHDPGAEIAVQRDSDHFGMVQTVIFLLVICAQGGAVTLTVEPTTPSAVIDRVSLVLEAFDGPGRLTLAQIVRRTGLPRSSAHRMLERLVQLRWLRRSGREYELGMRLVELGSLAVHQDRLHRAATPLLHDLHRATGLVVHLAGTRSARLRN
jgi:hypothetical protein